MIVNRYIMVTDYKVILIMNRRERKDDGIKMNYKQVVTKEVIKNLNMKGDPA